jgi:hypothetical protein
VSSILQILAKHFDTNAGLFAGSDNVIGKNIVINKQQLENMPSEYAESLTKFIEGFKKYNVPPEQAKPIQGSLNDLSKEVEGIKPEEKVRISYLLQSQHLHRS